MDNRVMGRLAKGRKTEGAVSPMDAVSRALFFAGTGQILPSSQPKESSELDEQLKRQRLLTGDPDFIREQNALKLKTEFDNKLAFDEAQIQAERKRQDDAMGAQPQAPQAQPASGSNLGIQPMLQAPMPLNQVNSPLGTMGKNGVPQFMRVPKDIKESEYDPKTGRMRPESIDYGVGTNPEWKMRQKVEEEKVKAAGAANAQLSDTGQFLRQYGRSLEELRGVDPNVDKPGMEGWIARKGGQIANTFDYTPETKAFEAELLPRANLMARTIEGGKITDADREIYANAFASALKHPSDTNIRLASNELLRLAQKGGDISMVLGELDNSQVDVLQAMAAEVRRQMPQQQPVGQDDFSSMSDEELRRIAGL